MKNNVLRTVKRLLLRIVFLFTKQNIVFIVHMIVIVLKIKAIHLILTLLFITQVYSLTESVCSPEKDCWFFCQ